MKSHSKGQGIIFTPAMARTHDPKTSWEAAESVDTNRLEKLVLDLIKRHGQEGAIHDEVYKMYIDDAKKFASHHNDFNPYTDMHKEGSITPRYATLERKGLITRNGDTRKGSAGRSQLVMYATKQ